MARVSPSACPSAVSSLVRIWCALHTDLEIVMPQAELKSLRRVLLEIEDDLVAALYAAKLDLGRSASPDARCRKSARLGGEIVYRKDGQAMQAWLVGGVAEEPGLLGIASRFGAALLGLQPGQSMLWPDEQWQLIVVEVLDLPSQESRRWPTIRPLRRSTRSSCGSG